LGEDDVVITGDGTACVVTFQTTKIKESQRMFSNSGCASMGYDLPAAIGAAVAAPDKSIVCLAGDGSVMMNIQELQTIFTNNLNIKIIVFNNNGYSSIRQTQQNYFPDNIVGCGPESGISFPDFTRLAEAFNIPSKAHHGLNGLKDVLSDFLSKQAFQFLEVFLDPEQPFAPKLSSRQLTDGSMVSGSLDDLAPFLSDEERISNRID
jgi:acetolactate synthase-1/2/3 large subunit